MSVESQRPTLPHPVIAGIGWTIRLIIKLSIRTMLCLTIFFWVQIVRQQCTLEQAVDAMIVVPQVAWTVVVGAAHSL